MRRIQKSKLLVGAIVSMCFATAVGVTSLTAVADQASEEVTKKTIEQVSFTMIEGAGVRLETDGNGLRFGASTTASDYTALMANVGDGADYAYKDIKFGMLIAPAYYEEHYELNEKYVFSADAKYDWAIDGEYKGTNGENGSKVRIANLQAREMFVDETKGTATYYGSIVDLNDGDGEEVNNLALQFKGIGYVQYTLQDEASTVKYKFLDGNDNVRSMAYVAQQAIADETSADRLTPAQKQTVNSIYVSKVTQTASSYTANYYLQNADGSYTLEKTVNEEKTIDAEVTLQNVYYADYHLAKGPNTTFKVLANDKSVLNFYYDRGAVWNTVANITDFATQTASHVDAAGTGNTNTQYNVSKETIAGKGEFIKWAIKDGKSNASYRHGFNVLPAYEKAYYELYQGKNYQLVFDFMYDAKVDDFTGTKYSYFNNKKDIIGIKGITTDTWYTAIQPLDTLIANWDALHIVGTVAGGPVVEVASLITLKTQETSTSFDIYIGNFRLVPPAVTAVEDTTVNLVDISSNNLVQNDKLNLMDLVSNENKTILQDNFGYLDFWTYTLTDSAGAITTAENGIVDISKITLRYYTFTIAYNNIVIYTGYVDLYDATQGVVWNTLDLLNTKSDWKTHQGATHNAETNQYYTFSVENIEKTKYAKWTANGHNKWSFSNTQGFALLPLHSLDYYKLFEGQGYKVSFEVNYYLQDTTSALTYSKYIKGNDGAAYTLACGAENWKKISFNLDSLITRYDYITKTSTSDGYSSALFTFQGYASGSSAEANKALINVYMSEMTIAKA